MVFRIAMFLVILAAEEDILDDKESIILNQQSLESLETPICHVLRHIDFIPDFLFKK